MQKQKLLAPTWNKYLTIEYGHYFLQWQKNQHHLWNLAQEIFQKSKSNQLTEEFHLCFFFHLLIINHCWYFHIGIYLRNHAIFNDTFCNIGYKWTQIFLGTLDLQCQWLSGYVMHFRFIVKIIILDLFSIVLFSLLTMHNFIKQIKACARETVILSLLTYSKAWKTSIT